MHQRNDQQEHLQSKQQFNFPLFSVGINFITQLNFRGIFNARNKD